MARPTRLTPDLGEAIAAAIRHGARPEVAAGAHGVPSSTFHEWMSRGEARDPVRPAVPLYIAFAESVRDAERQCEAAIAIMATSKIKTTADALAFLARRFGGEWREKTEVTIDLRTAVEALTSDEGERAAALAEAERILAGR